MDVNEPSAIRLKAVLTYYRTGQALLQWYLIGLVWFVAYVLLVSVVLVQDRVLDTPVETLRMQ